MEEPPAEERTEAETQEGEEAPTAGTKETQKEIEEEPQRPPRKPLLDEAILIATLLKESGTRR
jgi:hypothetical protein